MVKQKGRFTLRSVYQLQHVTLVKYAFKHHAEERRNSEEVCLSMKLQPNYAGTTYYYVLTVKHNS
jgi:hypothetical protein